MTLVDGRRQGLAGTEIDGAPRSRHAAENPSNRTARQLLFLVACAITVLVPTAACRSTVPQSEHELGADETVAAIDASSPETLAQSSALLDLAFDPAAVIDAFGQTLVQDSSGDWWSINSAPASSPATSNPAASTPGRALTTAATSSAAPARAGSRLRRRSPCTRWRSGGRPLSPAHEDAPARRGRSLQRRSRGRGAGRVPRWPRRAGRSARG